MTCTAMTLLLSPIWALSDGRIGVLYICHPVGTRGFDFMRTEPIFSLGFVAATSGYGGWGIEDIQRAVRLYMPRTYYDLVTRFDVIVLDNANRGSFSQKQVELLAKATDEGEVGLLMGGGWESFGGSGGGHPPWGESAIGRLLPTEDVEGIWVESGHLVIVARDHEFISSIPWERRGLFMDIWHHNLVGVKDGAQLLANVDRNTIPFTGEVHPLFVTWELALGSRVFACTGGLVFIGGVSQIPWEYYGDTFSNLMIYLDKRPVPQDIELVHNVRSLVFATKTRTSLLLSLLEFTESFGANTVRLMREIDSLNEMTSGATKAYVDLRFHDVLEAYQEVQDILRSLEEQAMELKNRALLWVYTIEYLTVTGTSLLASFVVWTMMVRRRLYREAGTTRLAGLQP